MAERILSAAGLLVLAGVFAALFFLIGSGKKAQRASSDASAETPAPTDGSLVEILSPTPTDAPITPEPTAHAPVRVSDEKHEVFIDMTISAVTDSETGENDELLSGFCLIEFVNNTDSALDSAELNVGSLKVIGITADGFAERLSVGDDGSVTVPFPNELLPNDTCEIFISFSGILSGGSIELPSFQNGEEYLLTAEIESDAELELADIEHTLEASGNRRVYSIESFAVKNPVLAFASG